MKLLRSLVLGLVGLTATVMTLEAAGNTAADQVQSIKSSLEVAKAKLEAVVDGITDGNQKAAVLEALRKVDLALSTAKDLESTVSNKGTLDAYVAEARFYQELMSGLFAGEDMFAHSLKEGPVDITINIDAVYDQFVRDRVRKNLGFVDIGANGRIRVRANGDTLSRFNSLKAKYYGVLVEAAAIDPSDNRVKALAEWGNHTKVRTSPRDSFGKEIIETQDLWNLKLK